MIKTLIEKLKALRIYAVSSSFSKVVIKNNDGILKTLKDTNIIPRTNNLLYVDGKRYQVTSNVFNYDERTIYVWVGSDF
jgi:hypothetical protein